MNIRFRGTSGMCKHFRVCSTQVKGMHIHMQWVWTRDWQQWSSRFNAVCRTADLEACHIGNQALQAEEQSCVYIDLTGLSAPVTPFSILIFRFSPTRFPTSRPTLCITAACTHMSTPVASKVSTHSLPQPSVRICIALPVSGF